MRKNICRSLLLVTLAICSGAAQLPGAQEDAYPWKAAMAKVVVTPKEPVWMAGYAARKAPHEEVIQDLYAKALAVEDEAGKRLVVVTLDLIGVPKTLRMEMEKIVKEKHGIEPGELLMNASHTHSGPNLKSIR